MTSTETVLFLLFSFACSNAGSAQVPATPRNTAPARLRVISAAIMDSARIAGRGTQPGTWLVVTIQISAPAGGLEVVPLLSGAGLAQPVEPSGISAESSSTLATAFLNYAEQRLGTFVSPWVRLTQTGTGRYAGAGLMRADSAEPRIHLVLTPDRRLSFERTTPLALTLLFDVAAGQGPYRLSVGDSAVTLSPVRRRS